MFLSLLHVNVGDDADRPRPGRLWLRNLYHVHQRLCMAFPSASRKQDDSNFLKPFVPDDFAQKQVHVTRRTDSGFLFRIDPQPGGRVVILVQSAIEPAWDYAFHNAGHLLAAPPETKTVEPRFELGQRLRFRLLANPTKKIETLSKEERIDKVPKRHGRRVPVATAELRKWLSRQGQRSGFCIKDDPDTQAGYVCVNKSREAGGAQRLWSVRYEGVLEVADPNSFSEALVRGIGPAKAFGFGLLSLAPVR